MVSGFFESSTDIAEIGMLQLPHAITTGSQFKGLGMLLGPLAATQSIMRSFTSTARKNDVKLTSRKIKVHGIFFRL